MSVPQAIWDLFRNYLFAPMKRPAFEPWTWYMTCFICRWKGHPDGIIFYNPGGSEPNYHCKNCGEFLG